MLFSYVFYESMWHMYIFYSKHGTCSFPRVNCPTPLSGIYNPKLGSHGLKIRFIASRNCKFREAGSPVAEKG